MKTTVLLIVVLFVFACVPDETQFLKDGATDQQFESDLEDCFDQVYEFGEYDGSPSPWGKGDQFRCFSKCMKSKGYQIRDYYFSDSILKHIKKVLKALPDDASQTQPMGEM